MALTQISTQGIKDGTITGSDLATNVDLVDNQKLRLGNSNDLQIYHDGSNSYIQDTDQGNLFIEASAVLIRKNGTTENIAKFIQDGAVELYYDNSKKFETAADRVNIYGHVFAIGGNYYLSNGFQDAYARFRNTGGSNDANFEFFVRDSGTETEALEITKDAHIRIPNDNKKLKIGAGDDLQLYHDGYNSYITNAGGELKLGSNHFEIRNGAQNSTRLASTSAGAVELFYDNSKKFETTSDGVSIPTDSTFLRIGAGQDLDLHHNGTNSYIRNKTGDLHIRPLVAEEGIILKPNGAVELYHDNSKKFETKSTGGQISGQLQFADGAGSSGTNMATFGSSDDLKIYHDGTNSNIVNSTNVLTIQGNDIRLLNNGASKALIKAFDGGEVELYFNGSKKLKTINEGIKLTELQIAPSGTETSSLMTFGGGGVTVNAVSYTQFFDRSTAGGNTTAIVFRTSGSNVGQVIFNNSATLYQTSSDYRLKENAVSISDGITRLKTLKPYRFNFKGESDIVDGFFAHEVTAVPEAISGTKDEVDSDNNPVYQGIDQSKLVPLLVAALQELVSKVEVLENEVAALKAA